jgi:hypothetical protein
VALTPADWDRLQDALIAASFWALDADGVDWPINGDEQRTIAAIIASRGRDGSDWLMERRRKDIFRAVSRWSPRGALRDLGKLCFEFAGPPLAEVRIYLSASAGIGGKSKRWRPNSPLLLPYLLPDHRFVLTGMLLTC